MSFAKGGAKRKLDNAQFDKDITKILAPTRLIINGLEEQLQQVYKTMQHKAKHERPKDKFDLEQIIKVERYNDTGVPITARAAKQKQKNRSMYAARAANTGLQVVN